MTLIAGFKCDGGIALCADTLEEAAGIKHSVENLIEYEKDWCLVGFAGAGDQGHLIDTVVDKIQSALDASSPEKFLDIKQCINDTLILVYLNEMAAFPQPPAASEAVDTTVTLLIAVKGKQDQNAELLLSCATALHPVSRYEIRGAGDMFDFVAKRSFRDGISLHRGVLLCTRLLGLSKTYVSGVGGESHVLVVTNSGLIQKAHLVETELSESFFDQFDQILGETFLLVVGY